MWRACFSAVPARVHRRGQRLLPRWHNWNKRDHLGQRKGASLGSSNRIWRHRSSGITVFFFFFFFSFNANNTTFCLWSERLIGGQQLSHRLHQLENEREWYRAGRPTVRSIIFLISFSKENRGISGGRDRKGLNGRAVRRKRIRARLCRSIALVGAGYNHSYAAPATNQKKAIEFKWGLTHSQNQHGRDWTHHIAFHKWWDNLVSIFFFVSRSSQHLDEIRKRNAGKFSRTFSCVGRRHLPNRPIGFLSFKLLTAVVLA